MNKSEIYQNNNMLRVAIYERLSDEDKDKINKHDLSESIKNQRHLLMEEVNKRENFILVGEYCDEDLSGAGTYRPEFERLIKDCEAGKIDVVLCKSQSRFSRDMEIIEKYLHNKFIEWKVRFISLADNADTANIGNKKSRQINGLVNEWYLEDVSNNIRSAFKAKMKQGEYISPFASFGYEISKKNNNKLVIDPVAAEVVRNIFNLYLTGLGFTAIAEYLNNKNIPSPSLYKYQNGIKLNIVSNKPREQIKWNTNTIKTILTNELYLGHLIQGKRTTISYKNHKIINKTKDEWIKCLNTHEAIIDEDTFKKVQFAMKERTKPIKRNGTVHLFSGKVFCLECNNYMRKKNSSKHEYLVCSNKNNDYKNCPNKYSIRYDKLEDLILNAINSIIKNFYNEKEIKELYFKEEKKKLNNKIKFLEEEKNILERQLLKNKNYLKNLYEDKTNKIITLDQFNDLIKNYNNNEDIYNNKILDINKKIIYYKEKINNFKDKTIKFVEDKTLKKINKFIIDEFISKIYIGKYNCETNSRIIKIKWNFE